MTFDNALSAAGYYEDALFEQALIEAVGELLPQELIEEFDPAQAYSVLEIGSGNGAWLRALGQSYPHLQAIGIEQDEQQARVANLLAQRDELSHVAFIAHDIADITPALFVPGHFDLVHLHLLARHMLSIDYPALLLQCLAMCRPGGIICWSEAELPMTTSPVFEQLATLVCRALEQSGQSFIMERGQVGQLLEVSRRHLGITPMIGGWLRQANCGFLNPYGHWAYGDAVRITHSAVYAVEFSSGLPLHPLFARQVMRFAERVRSFLLRADVIGADDYASLRKQLEAELHDKDFCGLAFLLRVWGQRA